MNVLIKQAGVAMMLSLFLTCTAHAGEEKSESDQLMERHRQIVAKIEALKQEQDFLLFQKAAYSEDSKYFILEPGAGIGKLKYKNRVLKSFSFPSTRSGVDGPKGLLRLVEKTEKNGHKSGLLFGKSLIIEPKGTAINAQDVGRKHIQIKKTDFLPLFYAVEKGALAYVVR